MFNRMIISVAPILVTSTLFFTACAGDDLGSFQFHDPQSIKLFEILDQSPALRSLFTGLDPYEFNTKTDDLVRADPQLIVKTFQKLADAAYGSQATLPQAMSDLADSLLSFHETYQQNPESLNTAYAVIQDILNMEANAMNGGADTLITLLKFLKNDGNAYGSWDFFGDNQELSDMGTTGVDDLIGSLNFVKELYTRDGSSTNSSESIENFLLTLRRDGVDVEARVQDIIDYIKNPATPFDTVEATEMEVADWLVADQDKQVITDFLMNHLYPMIKDPVLTNAILPDLSLLDLPPYISTEEDFKNFIKRGRWLLDDQVEYLKASASSISEKNHDPNVAGSIISSDNTNLIKWFLDGLYHDMDFYDHLENVNIFDFSNNELLAWLKNDIEPALNAALDLDGTGPDTGITPERMRQLLWSGWTYMSTSGAGTNLKGLMHVDNSTPANDGYLTKMVKTRSSDNTWKPFRRHIHDVLNGNNNGTHTDDGDSQNSPGNILFKEINLSYNNDEFSGGKTDSGDGVSESQLETFLTNMYLHIIADYYSPVHKKWALTPEDGQAYFGDPDKNIQTLLGGIQTSMRNILFLDREGRAPGDTGFSAIPMLSEFLYIFAAGNGMVDPSSAPAEISLHNCLVSMNSPLKSSDTIQVNAGDLGTFTVHALGDENMHRWSAHESGAVKFETQRQMPAVELLQPGTFRRRQSATNYEWHGKFSAPQGDIRGIANSNGKITITNFVLSEMALACWEGYGPYTYKGKAPNGSDCKYKNDWFSDSYRIDTKFTEHGWHPRGPGGPHLKNGFSRYHVYEAIYRPGEGESGFTDSGYTRGDGTGRMPKYGYIRPNKSDGSYNNNSMVVSAGNRVILDCASREEAIRKNFNWLINQKKYMFVIPMHPWVYKKVPIPILADARCYLEMWVYISINANGMSGLSQAKRTGNSINDNAIWAKSRIDSNVVLNIEGKNNTVLNCTSVGEPDSNTSRFTGVSFSDSDYCIAMDYVYSFTAKNCPNWLENDILNSSVNIPQTLWNTMGSGPVLPAAMGDNMTALSSLANKVYTQSDILSGGALSETRVYDKFRKFFDAFFPGASLHSLKDSQLPPIPRVNGVSYPTVFDASGNAIGWKTHTGDSKGKFEDILGIIVSMVGSFHEDGTAYKDIGGTIPAGYEEKYNNRNGGIAYFDRSGYRKNIDNIALTLSALNDIKQESNGTLPSLASYNTSWLAQLIDINPVSNSLEPGSRKGVLPLMMESRFMNLNNLDPIKSAIEGTIQHIVRTFLNNEGNFKLSSGGTEKLEEMYLKDADGNYELDAEGYKKINPAIDWDKPINRLRYFTDDRSLDRIKRGFDYIVDLSRDERFIAFLHNSIPAFNSYLAVKHIDQRYRQDGIRLTVQEAIDEGVFQISIEEDEPYTDENNNGTYDSGEAFSDLNFNGSRDEGTITRIVNFLDEFKYDNLINFIKETGINDIEKLYNFSFDHWADVIDSTELKKQIDSLNPKLIKYFNLNIKEGFTEGIYVLNSDIDIDLDGIIDFYEGNRVYGLGKYVESDSTNYDIEDNGRYYRYLDLKNYLFSSEADYRNKVVNNSLVKKVLWPGLKKIATIRSDEDYIDPWYRGGVENCPYIFSPHKYDLRLDLTIDKWNETLLTLKDLNFIVRQETAADMMVAYGKNNQKCYYLPESLINLLYGWNGTATSGLDIEGRYNMTKDAILDYLYDDKELEVNETFNRLLDINETDYINPVKRTISLRILVAKVREFLNEELFEYAYVDPDPKSINEPGELRETYMADESIQTGPGADPNFPHKHRVNNIIDIAVAVLHPESSHYMTERLFNAWQNFIDQANITPERLNLARTAIGALLYCDSQKEAYTDTNGNGRFDPTETFIDSNGDGIYNDGYTRLFTKLSSHLPPLLESFKGSYNDLVDLGIIAFGYDGLGEYLLSNMNQDPFYTTWDTVNEFHILINQDIFRHWTYEDTFWWQLGALLDDLGLLIQSQPHYSGVNYYQQTRSIFK